MWERFHNARPGDCEDTSVDFMWERFHNARPVDYEDTSVEAGTGKQERAEVGHLFSLGSQGKGDFGDRFRGLVRD